MRKMALGMVLSGVIGLMAAPSQAEIHGYDIPNVAGEGVYQFDLGTEFTHISSVSVYTFGQVNAGSYVVSGTDALGNPDLDTVASTPVPFVDFVEYAGGLESVTMAHGTGNVGGPIGFVGVQGWDFLLDGQATLRLGSNDLPDKLSGGAIVESNPGFIGFNRALVVIDGTTAIVPEPMALGTLTVLGGGLLMRRRR
ncbi:MAG TPA: hypothetical protein VHP11_05950 [Tepidisphaeraceae bacterium]|nr:hypothetical protein [Tepidisphaeraceae bacterium]